MHDDRVGGAVQVIILGGLPGRCGRGRAVPLRRCLRQPALQVWPGALSSVLARQLSRFTDSMEARKGRTYKSMWDQWSHHSREPSILVSCRHTKVLIYPEHGAMLRQSGAQFNRQAGGQPRASQGKQQASRKGKH